MTAPAVTVGDATITDLPSVLNVLDNGLLAVSVPPLEDAIDAGDVLVAVETEPILGALVLDGQEITAIAVRRRRRGQGIGRLLVEHASRRRSKLVAAFEARVRPFWKSVGFEIESTAEEGRLRGHVAVGEGSLGSDF